MNIITFDIEERFQRNDSKYSNQIEKWDALKSNLINEVEAVLNLLKETNQKATFFCTGWVAEKYPDIIRKIDSQGYEIGYHTYYHTLVSYMSEEEFRTDLQKGNKLFRSIINKELKYFKAPSFSINEKSMWAYKVLIEEGFTVDCSIFPARRRFGGIPKFKHKTPFKYYIGDKYINILPQNLINILGKKIPFSGGGYFQLLPYFIIKKFTEKSNYVITYFHNYNILSKKNIGNKKLYRYIKEFEFYDIEKIISNIQ